MTFTHYEYAQGSPEWLEIRAGKITGSMFSTALETLKSGQPSAAAKAYAMRLALERIAGKPLDDGIQTWAMQRGSALEPEARKRHSEIIGQEVKPSGFWCDGTYGSSPDGLIGDDGCSEYKCLVDPTRIGKVLLNADLEEFEDQIQAHLWVTGRSWCDFCVYLPQMKSVQRDMFRTRVYRNDTRIEDILVKVHVFNALVEVYQEKMLNNLPIIVKNTEPF